MAAKKGTSLREFIHTRGVVQTLDPVVAHLAIEGYQDEISPAQKADDAFYRQFVCPSCTSNGLTKEFATRGGTASSTWADGEATPQALLRCQSCRCLFNPRTGLVIEMGGHAPVFDENYLDPGVQR